MRKKDGFSLVELILVIFLISVMSCMMFSSTYGFAKKARGNKDTINIESIENALTSVLSTEEFSIAQEYFKDYTPENKNTSVRCDDGVLLVYDFAWAKGWTKCDVKDSILGNDYAQYQLEDGSFEETADLFLDYIDDSYLGPTNADYLYGCIGAIENQDGDWTPTVQIRAFRDSNKNQYADYWNDECVSDEDLGDLLEFLSKEFNNKNSLELPDKYKLW